jgi:hypothetical protein
MTSWADNFTGFAQSAVSSADGPQDSFEIRWVSPEPISGQIPGGHLTLGIEGNLAMGRRERSIREDVRCRIACERPQSEDELDRKYVYPLQNLMTLATDHPNALVAFIVRRPNSRDDIRMLRSRTYHDAEAAADLLRHQMLFSLRDIRERTIDLIGRWIEVSCRLSAVCDAYFAIQYKPDSFVDTKFFQVFQALEIYQRKRLNPEGQGVLLPASSLQGLLTGLLQEHWATVGPLFGGNLAETVEEVMKYRNYVVHRDSDLGDSSDYGANLYWLTQKLIILMKACLLTELGLSSEERVKLFRQNQLYVHIRGLAKR